jgi:hypothetical protein
MTTSKVRDTVVEMVRVRSFSEGVEKLAYLAAAGIGLGFAWLLYILMGPLVIGLLLVSFVGLMVFKIGFLWFLK